MLYEFHLHEVLRIGTFIETEQNSGYQRLDEEGNTELLSHGHGVLWMMKKFWE